MTDSPPRSQSPDVQNLARANAVEPEADMAAPDFRAVYEAEFSYVYRSLRRLGVADRDLEDLAHDVFVAFYRGLPTFEPGRPVRPWLFGICFRVASDHRRRARHRFEIAADTDDGRPRDFADGGPLPDEQMSRAQDRRLILSALAALDLDRRAVFVMHELDGFSMPEIAAALSAPLNTCYSRLRLAREDFASAVRRLRKKDDR